MVNGFLNMYPKTCYEVNPLTKPYTLVTGEQSKKGPWLFEGI